jgi:phosphoribosylformylglycinamidine synthase
VTAPPIAVLHAPGTNRDAEAALAIARAGGNPCIVPVGAPLRRFRAAVVPGGFSYGDALGAGARLALEVAEPLADLASGGLPILGICNGFQALVRAGLLPGGADGHARVTLTHNANGRFECRWVHVAVDAGATAGLAGALPQVIACPVAHGEGRIALDDPATAHELAAKGHVLFRYVDREGRPAGGSYPANPSGSAADIAGLCNREGNVWGLMPHPEDHIDPAQDPWGRPGRLGLALFQALVDRARAH